MFSLVWLLCVFPSASFLGGIFYWLKCYDFYFMLPLYVGFVCMLSSICHSFGNVLFFLGLAITGKDKDFRQLTVFHSSRAPSSVYLENCSSFNNYTFWRVGWCLSFCSTSYY